jgi:hypothetical protein
LQFSAPGPLHAGSGCLCLSLSVSPPASVCLPSSLCLSPPPASVCLPFCTLDARTATRDKKKKSPIDVAWRVSSLLCARVRVCVCVCVYVRVCMYIRVCMYACVCTYTHTHTYTLPPTHTHTHTHTHFAVPLHGSLCVCTPVVCICVRAVLAWL